MRHHHCLPIRIPTVTRLLIHYPIKDAENDSAVILPNLLLEN
jgi:hypothetical protein